MKYMLDTNMCIFIIKHKPQNAINRFLKIKTNEICISSITFAELSYGVEKSQAKIKNRIALAMFLSNIEIAPTGHAVSHGGVNFTIA